MYHAENDVCKSFVSWVEIDEGNIFLLPVFFFFKLFSI